MKFYFSLSTGLCGLIFKRSVAGKNLHPSSASASFLRTPSAGAAFYVSHPTLCGPTDCSPPGSSVHGIFQARILVWDNQANPLVSYSRGSSRPRDQPTSPTSPSLAGRFFTTVLSGKPKWGLKQKVQPGYLPEIGNVFH